MNVGKKTIWEKRECGTRRTKRYPYGSEISFGNKTMFDASWKSNTIAFLSLTLYLIITSAIRDLFFYRPRYTQLRSNIVYNFNWLNDIFMKNIGGIFST